MIFTFVLLAVAHSTEVRTIQQWANDAYAWILEEERMTDSNPSTPTFQSPKLPESSVDSLSASSSSPDSNSPTINSVHTESKVNSLRKPNDDHPKFFFGQVKSRGKIVSIPDQVEVPFSHFYKVNRHIRVGDYVVFTIGDNMIRAKHIYLRQDWESVFRTNWSVMKRSNSRINDEMDKFCGKVHDGVLSYKDEFPMVSTVIGNRVKHIKCVSMVKGKKIEKGDKVTFTLVKSGNDFFAKDVKISNA